MRTLCAVAIFALVSLNPNTLSAMQFWSVGLFNASCASWMASPKDHTDHFWILGFWTGLNYSEGATTGQSTDAVGIVSEIRKVCEEEPSLPVASAAASVHRRFKEYGK